jgi:hypothetical protein
VSKLDIAAHLGQRKHDAEFSTRNCLARVQHDAEHAPAGDYVPFRCDLCNWRGRVSGLALHRAVTAGSAG